MSSPPQRPVVLDDDLSGGGGGTLLNAAFFNQLLDYVDAKVAEAIAARDETVEARDVVVRAIRLREE